VIRIDEICVLEGFRWVADMPYNFLEEVAVADIAFDAWGEDLEEAFLSAADASMNVMVEDLESIQGRERGEIRLENEDLDMLHFDLLQEWIYYKDSEQLLLLLQRLRSRKEGRGYLLEAVALGEKIDPGRHHLRVDVKAVTLHRFRLERSQSGWRAHGILDTQVICGHSGPVQAERGHLRRDQVNLPLALNRSRLFHLMRRERPSFMPSISPHSTNS